MKKEESYLVRGEEGTGKSLININYKRVWELIGLFFIYGILFQILIILLAYIDWGLAMLVYTINIIIMYQVFIIPILKEMYLIKK